LAFSVLLAFYLLFWGNKRNPGTFLFMGGKNLIFAQEYYGKWRGSQVAFIKSGADF
jgi:hypothetical protein